MGGDPFQTTDEECVSDSRENRSEQNEQTDVADCYNRLKDKKERQQEYCCKDLFIKSNSSGSVSADKVFIVSGENRINRPGKDAG